MAERKPISKRVRFEIFKRDEFACQYCGRKPPGTVLEIDHIHPVASGGDNAETNLVTSCFDCNRGKGDRHLTAVIQPKSSEQMAQEIERAEQLEAYNEFLMARRKAETAKIESLGWNWHDRFLEPGKFVFGSARATSIRTFLKQLPEAEILEAMDLAFERFFPRDERDDKTWKYFCGICWTKIRNG